MARIPSVEEISKMSHEELEKAWIEQEEEEQRQIDKEEAANKSVKKGAKVTAEDVAWLRKASKESRERQSKKVHFEKMCPQGFIEVK